MMHDYYLPSDLWAKELLAKIVFYAITVKKTLVTVIWVTGENVRTRTMQNEESVFTGHGDVLFCECPFIFLALFKQ